MHKILLFTLLCFFTFSAIAQTTVNRKIAQRYDEFNNNAWEGKDSVVFNYNAFGLESDRLSIKGQGATTWSNFYRSTSTYDAAGNLKTQMREFWTNGAWLNNSKYTYTYNGNNQATESLYETWNSGANSWVNTGRIVNIYNSLNLQTKIETYVWNGSWQAITKQDWYYNGSNELMTKESYNFVNNAWEGQTRSQYIHAFGYVSNLIESIWINGQWVLDKQITSQINGSVTPPRIASITNYYRDALNNTWGFSDRSFYNYTGSQLSTIQSEAYDTNTTSWRNTTLLTNTYNTNNLLSEEVIQQYIFNSSTYVNDARRVLTYNSNNFNNQVTHYDPVGSTGWLETARDQYSYNTNDSLTYWLEEDYVASNFTPRKQYFYYYDNVAVGLNNLNNLFVNASLYPNPTTAKIYIRTTEKISGAYLAVIYSIEGKKVWSQLNTNPNEVLSFEIGDLNVGNYVLQLNEISSGKTQHFKLNKQ